MTFNSVKFLKDVQEWNERNETIRNRQAQIVDWTRELRKKQARLVQLQKEMARARNHVGGDSIREACQKEIAALQQEIEKADTWFRELQEQQDREHARNQPLAQLIESMRKFLRGHRIDDPMIRDWL